MYTGAVSNPGFNWLCSPACTELESVVMDWVAKMLGFNEGWMNAGGVGGGIIMVSPETRTESKSSSDFLNPSYL